MVFIFVSIGVTNLQAVTYTTIADGNWTSPSTWLGGVAPGSTINAADIVNIGHIVTYNFPNDLEVYGMVNIVSGTFRTALTGNGENRSVFIRPGGEWNMCNAKMILPIFSCGYECYTGANKSGNFSNLGGSIIIHNSTVHIAQNWEDVSNAGTGTRTFNGGCLIVGENFSNKGSDDLYDGICMEMGWHGSGTLKNEYRMTFQDGNILRLVGSGSFENVPSSPHGIFGGPGTPDIAVLYISNGNMVNNAAWTASVLNFCINGGSVSGSMTADFTNDVTNNDTPAACATAMDTTCTNCPQGTCMLVVTAEILDTISCTPGCDGSATAVIQEGTGTISCGTGAMTTYIWNTMPPQMTETATNLCAGTYTVTVTDAGGCSATASVTLEAPTNCCELIITCPPANGGTFDCVEDVPLPDINLVTVIDSCGPIVITVDDDTTGTGCGIDTMFITRDYFITDGTNIDTCTQLFRVVDDEAPLITCPANLTVSCLEDVPACPVDFAAFDALPGASATDNCDLTPGYSCSTGPLIGGGCGGTVTRTHTVTDDCGNSATCNQIITVDDNTPPVITCPTNITVSCEADVPACPVSFAAFDALLGASASDICDPTLTYACSTGPLVGGACGGTITRTHTVTDDCGNSATCNQTITVDDNTPPVITCPANATVSCVADVPACPVDFAAFDALPGASATDLCDPTLTYACSTGPLVGGPCGGTITRTHTVTDDCGNSATCNQTFTVDDNTPPVITCPANATVSCVADVPVCPVSFAAFDALPGASASDLCDPTLTYACSTGPLVGGGCGGTITRTHTVTDDCGNSATCTQTFTVDDNTPPVITCPTNVTVSCVADVPACPVSFAAFDALPGASASDLCDPTLTYACSTGPLVGGACGGTITRTHTVTDDCGNSATCNQIITVDDNTPPVITCPTNVTVSCVADVPACPVSFAAFDALPGASASDLCDPTLTYACSTGPLVGGACGGTITRTHTVTDDCGNSATCNQIITVDDNTPPVITCPANATVSCVADVPACPVDFAAFDALPGASASDLCDPTLTYACSTGPLVGGPCGGTITRTHTVTDDCGNSATCNQTFTVDDNTPPVITCPANATVSCEADVPACPVSFAAFDALPGASGTDICDPTLTYGCSTGPLVGGPCGGMITRTHTVTDDCGNSATCTQTFTVDDNTPPVITCPANATVSCEADVPACPISFAEFDALPGASGTDNCDPILTYACSTGPLVGGGCGGTITRTHTVTDDCGNSATCTQTFTVDDNTPPTITCPMNVTVQCASLVPPVDLASPITSDNCAGIVTTTHAGEVITNMTCANRFTLTRTYRATDACGNSATCNQIITVFDNTAPMITCPMNVTVQCASLVPPVNTTTVTTSDNCGGVVTVTHAGDVISNMTCVNRFTLTRTYRATDVCGNSATCNQIITVFDNTPPTITCPANVTVQCANLVPPVNTTLVVTSDNCAGTVTVTHVNDAVTNMTCINRFILTRTYRATDACGNSATCAQVITVFDNTPPTITCPPNVTVQCAAQVPPVNPASVITSDNCGGTVAVTLVSDVITNMTCINRFILTRTYRATDACGNSATCAQVITVFDNTPPVIVFVDPLLIGIPNGGTLEVQCFGQDPEWELPTFNNGDVMATDNCAGPVTVVFTDVLIDEGDCDVDGYINRYRLTWTATDACGNSSSLFIFMELIDTIPPVITGVPDDITVSCDEIPEPPTVMATDECLCACIILFDESDPDPGCQDGQIITRTWTAEDDCGNITVEVQNITLIDEEGPEMEMMVPELAGLPSGTVLEYTCNEGGIPAFFDLLSAESVNTDVSCGTAGIITFTDETIIANNCKFWGYIENREFTWEAVDQCGNTTSMSIIARLIDTEEPTLVGVPDTTCMGDPELNLVEVVDNCNNASVIFWDVEIPNPCGDGVAMRRTYEGIDDCGNTVRDTAILIPNDQTPPVLEFSNPVLAELGFGEVLIIDCSGDEDQYSSFGIGDVTVTDDCMKEMSVEFSEILVDEGDCVDGVQAVLRLVWTATDLCGNQTSLSARAHVVDQTPPVFDETEIEITIGCGDEMPEVSATDNCGEVTITTTDNIIPGDCAYEFDAHRTHIAIDPCGNISVLKQLIHVVSDGPEIEGVVEELCDDLSIPEVTAFDACADAFVEVTMTEDTLDVPCREGIVVERIWSAVDACGNISEVRQLIILGDETPPEILVPTNSVIRKFEGLPQTTVFLSQTGLIELLNELNAGNVFVLDDCDEEIDAEFSLDISFSENCAEDGYFARHTYSWIATDVCGNSDQISFTVDIMDDIPPVLLGVPADTIIICNELPPPPVVTSLDFGQAVIEYEEGIYYVDNEFLVIRTWTATDACGNSTSASQEIRWIPDTFLECDILLPGGLVECNTHGVVIGSDLVGGIGPFEYLWEISGEKCFIQSGQNTPEILIYVGWSEVEINLTVTDAFGCSSVCSALLSCLDPIDNLIVNPGSINPESNPVPQSPNATSNSLDILEHFNIWPNPAKSNFTLSFDSAIDHEVQYVLTNYLGQVVLSDHMKAIKGFNSQKIDVSHLPEGSYLMQVISEKAIRTRTIVLFRN